MQGFLPYLILISIIAAIIAFFTVKSKIWDAPQREISDLRKRESSLKKEIEEANTNVINALKQVNEMCVCEEFNKVQLTTLNKNIEILIDELLVAENEIIKFKDRVLSLIIDMGDTQIDINSITASEALQLLITKNEFLSKTNSNIKAIPYMASIIADYETLGLETLANKLEWGSSKEREKKVKSLRELRKETADLINSYKQAQYKLEYLLEMFPNLQDVIESEFDDLPSINIDDLSEYDCARDYLTAEEYLKLSTTERNQLALDNYKKSHNKTKWQIGRDYELFIGYSFLQKGYSVDYFGSYMGMEDLGRDLIVKKDNSILIVQCKYWSSLKQIHEKHITQLYGTISSYIIENQIDKSKTNVKGLLITNIELSDMAKKMAKYLNVDFREKIEKGEYPCIKCNIGRDEFGFETPIYHLPFDQQYDLVKIDKPGEFFATTVLEAEN